MKGLLAAWKFLSIIPVPFSRDVTADDLSSSVVYFPLVGLILGLTTAVFDRIIHLLLPSSIASILVVIFLFAITGSLHLDGLADTADGFLSSRPRERILEIMRDSCCGTMGVLAIVSIFALKCLALQEISTCHRSFILILTPVVGRVNALLSMNLIPYARKEGGLASLFLQKDSKKIVTLSFFLLGLAAFSQFGRTGLAVIFSLPLWGLVFSRYCLKKIGGFTGDTLGAMIELTELCFLLLLLVIKKRSILC